jgi:hypothetical protein
VGGTGVALGVFALEIFPSKRKEDPFSPAKLISGKSTTSSSSSKSEAQKEPYLISFNT